MSGMKIRQAAARIGRERTVAWLRSRGLLADLTEKMGTNDNGNQNNIGSDDDQKESNKKKKSRVYMGIDPTADGIHLGHLAGVMGLRAFQKHGFQPIALVGGATGMIGDPSGRDSERELLSQDAIQANVQGIQKDLEKVLDFGENGCLLVNNLDWFGQMNSLNLLRDVGKHFRVNTMLSRESVKSRLNNQEGISFTEFSYQLLQAYDFLHLYEKYECDTQIGGSDQWGNIVGGIDLIKKKHGGEAFGITLPLLTNKSGQKFGKSAGNAVWLNPRKTSDYEFYQFFQRVEDEDVEKLLYVLTELPKEEIQDTLDLHFKDAHKRLAQKLLCESVMKMVRGEERFSKAKAASEALFGSGSLEGLEAEDLLDLTKAGDVPLVQVPAIEIENKSLLEVFTVSKICETKGQLKRLAKSGGLYLNNERVSNVQDKFQLNAHSIEGKTLLLRSGKRNFKVLQLLQ